MATVTVGVTAASPGDHRLHLSGELHDLDLLLNIRCPQGVFD